MASIGSVTLAWHRQLKARTLPASCNASGPSCLEKSRRGAHILPSANSPVKSSGSCSLGLSAQAGGSPCWALLARLSCSWCWTGHLQLCCCKFTYATLHTLCKALLLFFSHSVMSDSVTHGLQHARLTCPSPSPGVCSNSCPLSR